MTICAWFLVCNHLNKWTAMIWETEMMTRRITRAWRVEGFFLIMVFKVESCSPCLWWDSNDFSKWRLPWHRDVSHDTWTSELERPRRCNATDNDTLSQYKKSVWLWVSVAVFHDLDEKKIELKSLLLSMLRFWY